MLEWGDIFHLPAWEIFPGTPEQRAFEIMQYTGLRDKYGKDIYEGDIIRSYDEFGKPFPWLSVVSYSTQQARFMGIAPDYINLQEVIGNIYENPDLLRSEENESNR
ncbi:YopX family protein [Alicyclobacillus acidoterrestris]|uniref:YopX family protein n=1 Tax=Alicyclobacillus acidoterrestris (strain ATCC 49025 / DSM 3922 / CIP 106132 / NCIMB 13137 / GD3B) TaxID=1356854 RepID=T0C5A9_ALIAG|nr:YopX family protein [Alicyclobacillus acidoterrestris]EPZ47735.1 hypothetical protein N007_05630 [Alicyclobacillus acidoterrestris ATCC 49025]UNO47957.1 YopX family protein [Alicyclobacillus acidoterrestris]